METVSEREPVHLGYAPRDPFTGAVLNSQRLNSSVDFHDVFGGPPRRSLIYESRRNRADLIDLSGRTSRGRGDSAESHRSGEMPVFGDGSGLVRRRQLGEDFYSDIFQSSDSACSSPKRGDLDALLSSPASRANSPNRPKPIRPEPLFEGFSLLQSSLSEKMVKGLDHPSNLKDYISNRQFHFSIYRWAGKGVMLVMPSDSIEREEVEGRLTRLPEIIVQEVELPSQCDNISHANKIFGPGTVTREKKSGKKEDDYLANTAEFFSLADLSPGPLNDDSNLCGDRSEKPTSSCFDENSYTNNTNEKPNIEFNFNTSGEQSLELKNTSQLFDYDIEKMNKARGKKVKGKVKEFIKKFNQELSPKRKAAFEKLDRRHKFEYNIRDEDEELTHAASVGVDKIQGKNVNNCVPLFDIPQMFEVNQVIENAVEEGPGISCDGHMFNDLSSEGKIELIPPHSEIIPQVGCHEKNVLEDIDGYLVQQLAVNQGETAQNSPQKDQFKNLDEKIWQWSRGKEGNIRSLLSTLQLVLWPESGWKPVPLVNIIEGPSVKKAYQKALLYLHPDKLQQKGASSSQKYVAEKVFDILQIGLNPYNASINILKKNVEPFNAMAD